MWPSLQWTKPSPLPGAASDQGATAIAIATASGSPRTGMAAGLRNTRPGRRWCVGGEPDVREPGQQRLHGDAGLEAGQVHPDADVRAGGERQVPTGVGSVQVEAVGVGERRRVAVGAGQRHDDEVAGARSTRRASVTSRVA